MASSTLTRDSLRILMIEDSLPDIYFYSDLLKNSFKQPVKINTAPRMKDVPLLMSTEKYDLVLIDLNVIDSEGVSTVKSFRKVFGKQIPIIVLTGNNDGDIRINALLAGADDYLVKGRDDKMLCERIIHYAVDRYELIRMGHEDKRFL